MAGLRVSVGRIVAHMDERPICERCDKPIDVGEAWMEADRDGSPVRAHAACLYRDEPGAAGLAPGGWEPQEQSAG